MEKELSDRKTDVWMLQRELGIAGLRYHLVSGDPDIWHHNGEVKEDAVYAVEALIGEKLERTGCWEGDPAMPEVEDLLARLTGVTKMDEQGFLDVALGMDATKVDPVIEKVLDILPSNRTEAIHILAFILVDLLKSSSPDPKARTMLTTWTLKLITRVFCHG